MTSISRLLATIRRRPRGAGPYRRYWWWTLALGCGLLLLAAVQALLFWHDHVELFQDLQPGFRTRLAVFTGILAASTLGVFLLVLRYFFQAYVVPLHRLEEDLEALAVGTPEARVDAAGAEGAERLAGGLNRLMERYQYSEARIGERVAEATASADAETKQLGTVLDSLGQSVIVCDAAGAVVRYNRTARSLLEPRLGRPVYGIVEKELCDYALETVAAQLAAGVRHPSVEFTAERAAGDPLWGRIAPVAGDDAPLHGFVLTLEETARPLSSTELLPAVRVKFHTDPELALLRELRFVVFDTETTGLSPSKGDEIISVGAVVVAQGRVVAEEVFETLVNPGIPVSAASTRIHGLTNDDLEGQPGIDETLVAFARFTEEAVLVAHNASFDMEFLKRKEGDTGIAFRQPVLCTLILSAIVHPNQSSHALDTLLTRYGIRRAGRHAALGDARMTAELLLRLLPQLEARGITTLEHAVRASRLNPLSRLKY